MKNGRLSIGSRTAAFLGSVGRSAVVYLGWTLLVVAATPAPAAVETLWALLCCGALVWWATSSRPGLWRGSGLASVGKPPARWWPVLAAIVPVILFAQAIEILYSGLPFVPDLRWPVEIPDQPSWEMLRVVVLAVVVFPVIEEVACRGCLQGQLRESFGGAFAIGCAAVLFALPHGNPAWYPLYVLLGVLLGIAVHVTGSLWAGFILHAAYNGVALLLHHLDRAPGELGPSFSLPGMVGAATVAVLSGAILVRLTRAAAAGKRDSVVRAETRLTRFATAR